MQDEGCTAAVHRVTSSMHENNPCADACTYMQAVHHGSCSTAHAMQDRVVEHISACSAAAKGSEKLVDHGSCSTQHLQHRFHCTCKSEACRHGCNYDGNGPPASGAASSSSENANEPVCRSLTSLCATGSISPVRISCSCGMTQHQQLCKHICNCMRAHRWQLQ